jgi:hypothetical protein
MNSAEYCNIINRINELQKQLYQITYQYKAPLYGYTTTIYQYNHKISSIRGTLVLDQDGNQVFISIKILSDQSVQCTSNIDMTNLTLYLF